MDVRAVTADELDALLPLIADYQRFYGNAAPDDARNAAFFGRFVAPSELGMLLGAYDAAAAAPPSGYACLYWTFSSVSATEIVLLNDLFVRSDRRGAGVGEALIAAGLQIARERGASHLRWWTALDNRRAQRLYERAGAQRSAWFEYEIATQTTGDLAARGPTPIDAAYAAYDERPLNAPDAWGDLASFRSSAAGS